jgi:hypothetical protein
VHSELILGAIECVGLGRKGSPGEHKSRYHGMTLRWLDEASAAER